MVEVCWSYVNKDLKGKLEKLREWVKNGEKRVKVLIGRDFNAKMGGKKGEGDGERKRRDRKINEEGNCVVFWGSWSD